MFSIGVRGHDLSEKQTIAELGSALEELTIQTVQFAFNMSFPELVTPVSKLNSGLAMATRQALADKNVRIGVLSCYINMIHPDLVQREAALQRFETYLSYANSFGAPLVATETGCVHPEIHYTAENYTEKAFQDVVQVVKRLTKTAAQHGTLVGIEPGINHPIYSPEKTLALIAAVDATNLKIVLDPTNLITAETYQKQADIIQNCFDLFGNKIDVIHLKDFIVKAGQIIPVAFGEGVMDIPWFLNFLKDQKPGITIILEETKDRKIATAVEFIKEWSDR